MADAGIKKVNIKRDELPLVQLTKTYNSTLSRYEIDKLKYNFRYRVISEDKNRYSYWSNVEEIIVPDSGSGMIGGVPYFPYTDSSRISTIKDANNVVTTIWNKKADVDASDFEKIFYKVVVFDIWIRWNATSTTNQSDPGWSSWEYRTAVSTNSYSIINPIPNGTGSYKAFDIAIQVPSTEKIRDYFDTKLTLFRKTTII